MKRLKPFAHRQPASLREAVEIFADPEPGTYLLAGGTDLLVRMKRGEIRVSTLVNLKSVDGLDGIAENDETGMSIGALTRIADIAASSAVRAKYPGLAQAAGLLGSPSIRNLATIGGNIGRASPASDIAPSLIVLNARITAFGRSGTRTIEMDRFFAGPGAHVLFPGEIIVSIGLPEAVPGSGSVYMKLGRTAGVDCALAGVAVYLHPDKRCRGLERAGIALASVAGTPVRAAKAERELLSGAITEDRIRKAALAASEECAPIDDMRAGGAYRREMVRVLTERALSAALLQAEKNEGTR